MFVALMKQLILKDTLKSYQWVGIVLNCLSILLVGFSAMMVESKGKIIIRVVIVIVMVIFDLWYIIVVFLVPNVFYPVRVKFYHYKRV